MSNRLRFVTIFPVLLCLLFMGDYLGCRQTVIGQEQVKSGDGVFKMSDHWRHDLKGKTIVLTKGAGSGTADGGGARQKARRLAIDLDLLRGTKITLYLHSSDDLGVEKSGGGLLILPLKKKSANILIIDLRQNKPRVMLTFKKHQELNLLIQKLLKEDVPKDLILKPLASALQLEIKYLYRLPKIISKTDGGHKKDKAGQPHKIDKPIEKKNPVRDKKPVLRLTPLVLAQESMVQVFAVQKEKRQAIRGQGFFISKDGFIVTPLDFLLHARKIKVLSHISKRYQSASIYAVNARLNLALIKIKPPTEEGLPWLRFSEKPSLAGERVTALQFLGVRDRATSLMMTKALSHGKVLERGATKKQKTMGQTEARYIPTDLKIYQGNSHCPIVNSHGKLVGLSQWLWEEDVKATQAKQNLSAEHIRDLYQRRGNEPLTGKALARAIKGMEIPRSAIYQIYYFNSPPRIGQIVASAKALRRHGLCPLCHGRLKVSLIKQRLVLHPKGEQVNTTGRYVHYRKIIPCKKRATNHGYNPLPTKLEQTLFRLVHDLLASTQSVYFNDDGPSDKSRSKKYRLFHKRYSANLKFVESYLKQFISVNPDFLTGRFNHRFKTQLEKKQLRIGQPVMVVLQSLKYIPINDEPKRFWSGYIPETDIEVLVDSPLISRINGADQLFVGGIIKGLPNDPSGKMTPILQGAFIMSAKVKKNKP